MYMTVRHYEGVTDSAEAGRRVAEGFVPLLQEIEGFVSYSFADAGGGVMVSVGQFTDQAGADASTERARDWVAENLAELIPNPPSVTAGEVVASS